VKDSRSIRERDRPPKIEKIERRQNSRNGRIESKDQREREKKTFVLNK
jgi:hypothetical protein